MYATNVILLSFGISIIVFSWQTAVRSFITTPILLDEIVLVAPVLLWLVVLWWITSPVENKLSYVLHRLRLDVCMLGFPILLLMAVSETAHFYQFSEDSVSLIEVITFLIMLGNAPRFMAWILPAKRMLRSELLEQLVAIGNRAKLSNIKIYVWNTNNRIMNALAFGMVFQAKTVVLTDTLISSLTSKELHAVVTHELAHHKYWHIPFCMVTVLSVIVWTNNALFLFDIGFVNSISFPFQMLCILGAVIFVSRQFEEQADVYAAVDQSKLEGSTVITKDGANVMCSALSAIARVHSIPLYKNDPMHRSIGIRQENLRSNIGVEFAKLPILKKVKWIKIMLLLSLALGIIL
jgi:Zn-dependent protease with chaperone function